MYDDSPTTIISTAVLAVVVTAVLVWRLLDRRAASDDDAPSAAQVLSLIKQRRSIFPKDYTGQIPPKESLEAMLEAANWAPTHGKTEPWRFVVMNGQGLQAWTALVAKRMEAKLGATSEAFKKFSDKAQRKAKDKAKVAYMVAICMKRKALPDKEMPEWEEVAAVASAVQNMHLMATALGVAAYWSSGGPIEDPEIVRFLGLDPDAGDRCLGLFHVGHAAPATVAGYRSKRGPVQAKTTWMVD